MENRKPAVLLIGESPQGFTYLSRRLAERGCRCHFAGSYAEACGLLRREEFDLVVSQIRLRDQSLYPLINLLEGTCTTLFYSQLVEDGCWWLPALRQGEDCFGSAALRPSEFMGLLEDLIKELCAHLTGERRLPPSPPLPDSLVSLPARRGVPIPAERPSVQGLITHKTAS